MLARLQAEYDAFVPSDDIPIFTNIEQLKGLGLATVINEVVPFQFVDVQKRKVYKCNSRRQLEEVIGNLTDEEYKRYENQESILILKDEKPVEFEGIMKRPNYNNVYWPQYKRDAYDKAYNDTVNGHIIDVMDFEEDVRKPVRKGIKDGRADHLYNSRLQ